MLCAELYTPKIHILKPSSLLPQNVTGFGDYIFEDVIKFKMRPLEWALIQSECVLIRDSDREIPGMHTLRGKTR